MRAAVVDASVAAKWVLDEEHSEQAALLLGYDALHAPSHWRAEAVNAVWGYVLRGILAAEDARDRALALVGARVIEADIQHLLPAAFEISVVAGVTVYDSLYIALAAKLALPLVTADRRLIDRLGGHPVANTQWIGSFSS